MLVSSESTPLKLYTNEPSGHSVSARPRKARDIVFILAAFDTLK